MTTYYRLIDEVAIPGRWHLGAAALSNGDEPRLRVGIPYTDPEVPTIPVTHPGRVLDFSLTSYAVPVVTAELAEAVAAVARDEVQRVPVHIPGHASMVVLNALRVLRCVDEVRSEFIKWTVHDHRPDLAGQYRQISTLVLSRRDVPPNAQCFRVDGYRVLLIVSHSVKGAMESAGCLGAKFIEVAVA